MLTSGTRMQWMLINFMDFLLFAIAVTKKAIRCAALKDTNAETDAKCLDHKNLTKTLWPNSIASNFLP